MRVKGAALKVQNKPNLAGVIAELNIFRPLK